MACSIAAASRLCTAFMSFMWVAGGMHAGSAGASASLEGGKGDLAPLLSAKSIETRMRLMREPGGEPGDCPPELARAQVGGCNPLFCRHTLLHSIARLLRDGMLPRPLCMQHRRS